jgi:hypothetical protein
MLLFAEALLNASQAPRQSAEPLRPVRHPPGGVADCRQGKAA